MVLSEHATRETLTSPVTLEVDIASLLLDEANQLIVTRDQGGAGRLYYSAWLRYFLPVDTLPARNQGIQVERHYEAVDPATLASTGAHVEQAQVGDLVQVRLTVEAPNDLYYFTLEDPIPAGFEVVDPTLATATEGAEGPAHQPVGAEGRSPFWYGDWSQSIIRDEKVALFSDRLPRGAYEYTYLLRATAPGNFNVLPAVAYEQYHPEVFGRTAGSVFAVEGGQ